MIRRVLALSLFALGVGCGGEDAAAGGGSGGGASGGMSGGGAGGAAGAASGGTAGQSTGGGAGAGGASCGTSSAGPGDHVAELEHAGATRSYRLHVPPGFDDTRALPLVLNFHGLDSNPMQQELFSAMDAKADAEGFAVAYPQGLDNSWNAGVCCAPSNQNGVDDVGFVRAVIDDAASKLCVDRARVYATGMSNGGFLSHRLGCEAADVIAAIAPVDGVLGLPDAQCQPARPLPIVHFYGTTDPLVAYALAPPTNATWLAKNACTDSAPIVTVQQGSSRCETWSQCQGGVEVTFCTLEGMGHCWPGQTFCPPGLGQASTDIVANDVMWELFSRSALP